MSWSKKSLDHGIDYDRLKGIIILDLWVKGRCYHEGVMFYDWVRLFQDCCWEIVTVKLHGGSRVDVAQGSIRAKYFIFLIP